MANERTINKRRRKLAAHLFEVMLPTLIGRYGADEAGPLATKIACDAADVLLHEFDERGWQ